MDHKKSKIFPPKMVVFPTPKTSRKLIPAMMALKEGNFKK